jgi:hypothetical protein
MQSRLKWNNIKIILISKRYITTFNHRFPMSGNEQLCEKAKGRQQKRDSQVLASGPSHQIRSLRSAMSSYS